MSESLRWQSLWGKTEKGTPRYHPLFCHMVDVGTVCRLILENPEASHLRLLLARLLGSSEEKVPALIAFLISLHDLGKVAPSFQSKAPDQWARLDQVGYSLSPRPVSGFDHGLEAYWALQDLLPGIAVIATPLEGRHLRRFYSAVSLALGSHHGTFYSPAPMPHYPEISAIEDPREPWREPWRLSRLSLLAALRELFLAGLPPIPCDPANLSALAVALDGLCILSDWIGSDESYFPPYQGALAEYPAESVTRATRALSDRALFSFLPSPEADPDYQALFPDKLPPRPLQEALGPASLGRVPSQFLAILEAPTGEGKTEAALLLASRAAAQGSCRGFYFALPTMATSNQMYNRVAEFLDRHLASGETACLLLVNGQADLHEGYAERIARPHSASDEDHKALADSWLLPRKRSLLSPYGVGTVDQAMMAALNVRHGALRLLGLSGKVLIIDEVHAYDLYMSTILHRLLAWARPLGTSVILLSATLPSSQRARLIEAYSGVKDQAEGQEPRKGGLTDYPLITLVDAASPAAPPSYLLPACQSPGRRILLDRRPDGDGHLACNAGLLVDAVRDGGCAAWILNTVAGAQHAFLELRSQVGRLPEDERPDLWLFHARFPLGVRRRIEEEVVSRFGTGGDRPVRAIVVASPVVEQSLDLDFDLMMTQLAPADLLLQRAGRLHRHTRVRPGQMASPRLVLLMPDSFSGSYSFGGSRFIYHPLVLLRTMAALAGVEEIRVPEDVRQLVETVYQEAGLQPEALASSGITADALASAQRDWESQQERQRGLAQLRLLGEPDPKGTFSHNPGLPMDDAEADRDAWVAAQTRLAEPSVRLVLLEEGDDLPGHLLPEREDNQVADAGLARALLLRSVSLAHRALVEHVVGTAGLEGAIRPLDHIRGLRGHYLLTLTGQRYGWTDGQKGYSLSLHPDLGVVIE